MKANINPVSVFPSTAQKLYINNVFVNLGESVSFQWWLQDVDDKPLTTGTINISGSDYNLWNDDNYLYIYTANKIGVIITTMTI
jgi:hypothetical protein